MTLIFRRLLHIRVPEALKQIRPCIRHAVDSLALKADGLRLPKYLLWYHRVSMVIVEADKVAVLLVIVE